MHDDFPFRLSMLALDHMEVDRTGFLDRPGTYHWTTEFRVTDQDEVVLCLIVNEVVLQDSESRALSGTEEPSVPDKTSNGEQVAEKGPESDATDVARIHMAHMGIFTKPDIGSLSSEQRAELVDVTRMSVQPLLRAQVLASTADLGFPPLTLPLLLRGQLPPAIDLGATQDDGADSRGSR
ncbi:hypothetical protein [Ruania zhangjianzhongii]|uniref:hypothetical protein n=1 Tax=Ruania zhangjianzhongii TaxID=2603206 RepID=UPI0011C70AAB|nr:hypothetical protein [Ruania zhangjianzhongii]